MKIADRLARLEAILRARGLHLVFLPPKGAELSRRDQRLVDEGRAVPFVGPYKPTRHQPARQPVDPPAEPARKE